MSSKTVHAPISGVFYRRLSPDQPPVKVAGDPVRAGDTIGLVEVMKTFTPVTADEDGTLTAFHVEDEQEIIAGQPLYDLEV